MDRRRLNRNGSKQQVNLMSNINPQLPRLNHLVPEEQILARRFMVLNPIDAVDWTFDLHLGEGMTPDSAWPSWLRSMAKSLTQRRVDLVCFVAGVPWIIELKQRANIHAIGQLLVYQNLYIKQFPHDPTPELAIVCKYAGYDLYSVLEQFKIHVFYV